jgi:hypothetical protein
MMRTERPVYNAAVKNNIAALTENLVVSFFCI